jgi:hypothetical protein
MGATVGRSLSPIPNDCAAPFELVEQGEKEEMGNCGGL